MNPFGASAELHRPTPPGHISSAHSTGKDEATVRMNVAVYQEKKDNENTGKRAEGEKQSTNFREIECCSSLEVKRASP